MTPYLNHLPGESTLLTLNTPFDVLPVNGHVHTPYSFSAFDSIGELFQMAVDEKIAALGINDFFVTDGYDEFCRFAANSHIFPLFNIEFISLMKAEQQLGIRVNDPNNPGRCYFSGKGLDYPFRIDDNLKRILNRVVSESQNQMRQMIAKMNEWLRQTNVPLSLTYEDVKRRYARELVRERHLAKALRVAVFEHMVDKESRLEWLTKLFGGKVPASEPNDVPALENEIRSYLLKSGGPAFVEEDDKAFLSLEQVIEIISMAGGIPCYPVLLDDKNGGYTEFEADAASLLQSLRNMQIGCIELIPGRNDATHLERFVQYFNREGFVILLGTEHNTPDRIPLTCDTRGRKPLSAEMARIGYEGACVTAAHQYLRNTGKEGFLRADFTPDPGKKDYLVNLGNALLHTYKKQPHRP